MNLCEDPICLNIL